MFVRLVDWFFKRCYHWTSGCERRPVSIPAVGSAAALQRQLNNGGLKRPTYDLAGESKLHRWFLAWAVLTGRMDALDWGE